MASYIAAENLNSDGEAKAPKKPHRGAAAKRSWGLRCTHAKKPKLDVGGEDSDDNDDNFTTGSSESESSDDSAVDTDKALSNAEVRNHYTAPQIIQLNQTFMQLALLLPSKTIPTTGRGSGSQKRKRKAPELLEEGDQQKIADQLPGFNSAIPVENPGSNCVLASLSGTKQTKANKVRI